MLINTLNAISPLDGRYADKVNTLRPYFSEFGFFKYRLIVEINWLKALSAHKKITEVPTLSESDAFFLQEIIDHFDEKEANRIKEIEATTNHDVKAVEYYLKEKLQLKSTLASHSEFIHFACTSEDINNLAYGLMLKNALSAILIPEMIKLTEEIRHMAHANSTLPMLSRTHGQPASPTTLGKEFANFYNRLKRQIDIVEKISIFGKINGAVGNYNAHYLAYPDIDWLNFSKKFVEDLGLAWNPYTTQIEPHDFIAELCDAFNRFNTILIGLNRDIWSYISIGYFQQRVNEEEVGSSTMPHKVNPIDFENSEGNLGLANAILGHFSAKLPISRWQRDLTDSTVLRNIGVGFGHALIAYQATRKGFKKLQVNEAAISNDLMNSWEILGEALQTIMRKYNIAKPYEKLKALTRGKQINENALRQFIESLNLPQDIKEKLCLLTPETYIGIASFLAKKIE